MTASGDRLRLVATHDTPDTCTSEPDAVPPSTPRAVGGEAGERIAAHVPSLFACVRALAGDHSAVDDIVHETVAQALEGWRRYDPTRDLGAWLRGIAVHLVRRHWRAIRRRQTAVRTLAAASAVGGRGPADPEADLSGRQQAERLLDALDRLPPALREAFVLRVVEGMPAHEAARALGTSSAAIHTRVCKARTVLLEAIGADRGRRGKGHDHG